MSYASRERLETGAVLLDWAESLKHDRRRRLKLAPEGATVDGPGVEPAEIHIEQYVRGQGWVVVRPDLPGVLADGDDVLE